MKNFLVRLVYSVWIRFEAVVIEKTIKEESIKKKNTITIITAIIL